LQLHLRQDLDLTILSGLAHRFAPVRTRQRPHHDASIRRMLERTLAAEGYAVTAVADGGAALAGVERSVPDVIVLDVAMPGLDGWPSPAACAPRRCPSRSCC
jgi:CheY-like chemotaxis protein